MATLGGQILHQAGKYVLDRIQTAGPGDLNIPEEKIYELGNFESIGTIRDIPEISFQLESYDMSTEMECILVNEDPTLFSSTPGLNEIDFRDAVPIDIISPWKSRRNQYNIVSGVVIPYLTLESATYRFGVGENSTQSFTLRGDSIFYTLGSPYTQEFTNTGIGPYTIGETARVYNPTDTEDVYILSVCLVDSTSGAYKRVFFDKEAVFGTPAGSDTGYSNTSTQFRLPVDESADYDTIRVTYGSTNTTEEYTQTGNNPHGEPVHRTTTLKPAAVRGKDIDVYIGSTDATPVWTRMNSVQSFETTWSVSLENDEELGNERYVSSEYDVPEVTGSIGVKPFDPADLFNKIGQITGVDTATVVGANITNVVPLEIRVSHPDTGDRLKTFYIPDARFTVPGYSGQANTKLETSMNFSSESGVLYVYNGERS